MENRYEGKQYSFRLNLDNPEHLKIYRVLEDLNLDIYKSKASFMIKAIAKYIDGYTEEELMIHAQKKKEIDESYVRKKDIEDLEARITANVIKEVAQMLSNSVMRNQASMSPDMIKQIVTLVKDQSETEKSSDAGTTDAALEEMSLLFASGNFGEE